MVSNPQKPRAKDSGRTVVLEEVCRLQDESGNSDFIKNPHFMTAFDDGSLVFLDPPFLYKHDKNGKLVFKALKDGTGPGEYQSPSNYLFYEDRIFFLSDVPPKVLELDADGRYVREFRTPHYGYLRFLKRIDNKIYGIRDEIRFSEFILKEGIFDTPYTLYEISSDFSNMKKIFEFPVKHYIKRANWWRKTDVIIVSYEHYLFIVHTAEYEVTKLDLRSGKIERIFKRPYSRLKSSDYEVEQDRYQRVPKAWLPPPEQYIFDIIGLQVYKDTLWVFTSSSKNHDGVTGLIDVFDMEGRYIDNFFLQFPADNENHWFRASVLSASGFLFTVLEDKDTGLLSIAKYRMLDGSPKKE